MKADWDWLNWTFGADFRNGFAVYLGPLVVYRPRRWKLMKEGQSDG